MNTSTIVKQSLIALKANKLRSIFSILGIVIGVSAVVIILSLGQGLKGLITNEMEAFGPNMLDIAIKIPGVGQMGTVTSMVQGIKITTLKLEDVKDLKDKSIFPYIKGVSGQVVGQEWANYKDNEKRVMLYGCGADYPSVMKIAKIREGRFFNQNEEENLNKVVAIGSELADKFFENEIQ